MSKVKYIKTEKNQIIIFSEYHQHSEFKKFNPISAGFVYFDVGTKNGELICKCYGESVSLKLKADEEIDEELVRNQILGYGYF